jgi:hypothetical protein
MGSDIALVANSINAKQQGDTYKPVPDDRLFVIDSTESPPLVIDTLHIGKQPLTPRAEIQTQKLPPRGRTRAPGKISRPPYCGAGNRCDISSEGSCRTSCLAGARRQRGAVDCWE